jgi:predicted nuclease with RNAse H fold
VWAGVDVGGRRKGFHVAVVDARLHVTTERVAGAVRCAELLAARSPAAVVGVDAPPGWAEPGASSRAGERAFARARVCGIRFTPDEATAAHRTDRYYEWVEHGLELWAALRDAGLRPVEVFPTASWTRWLGGRASQSRAAWSSSGLAQLAPTVGGVERVRDQDTRDAVAAALTARQSEVAPASVESFDGLVVPRVGTLGAALGT